MNAAAILAEFPRPLTQEETAHLNLCHARACMFRALALEEDARAADVHANAGDACSALEAANARTDAKRERENARQHVEAAKRAKP